jgi:hypothetical protein
MTPPTRWESCPRCLADTERELRFAALPASLLQGSQGSEDASHMTVADPFQE